MPMLAQVESVQSGDSLSQHQPDFALSPVTIISLRSSAATEEQLVLSTQDRLAHDGGALLANTPAVSLIRKAGQYGFDPVLRGFKYDQLNIVIDGVQSATAACPNRMDPATSQVAPNMMTQIEVLKGPHSMRFGTGLGGTINFRGIQPSFAEERQLYGRLSGSYESNGQLLRSETLLGVRGTRYDLGLFGSWSQGQDYQAGQGGMVQAAFMRASVGGQLGLRLGDRQQLTLNLSRNMARDADFPALPMDLRRDDTWLFRATHSLDVKRGALHHWQSSAYLTHVDHLMDNLLKPLDPRMMNAETEALTLTVGGRSETHWKWQQTQLYLGADLRLEAVEGLRTRTMLMGPMSGMIMTDDPWMQSRLLRGGLFAEYQWQGLHWYAIGAGRLQVDHAEAMSPGSEFAEFRETDPVTQLQPSLSLGGGHRWLNGLDLSLWLARAQRGAGISERFINFFPIGLDPYELVGNPLLNPEVNHQLDLSARLRRPAYTLEVTAFASYLTDWISSVIDTSLQPRLPKSPGVRRFENLDQAFMTGLEVSWQQVLWGGLSHQLSMAYTYGENLADGSPLPEIAPLDLRYALQGAYLNGQLRPELSIRHVQAQERIAEVFGETATPGFTLIDANMAYQPWTWLSLTVGIQNLFDVRYYEHLTRSVRSTDAPPIYAMGRNVFATLSVNW